MHGSSKLFLIRIIQDCFPGENMTKLIKDSELYILMIECSIMNNSTKTNTWSMCSQDEHFSHFQAN